MLKAMNFLREGGFKAATQHIINAQHRAGSFSVKATEKAGELRTGSMTPGR